ncbi:MAG: metallophosphoesterase [Planctomycetota bacterium]
MPLVAQVSDLHLSPRVPARQAQAEQVIAGINAAKPDLTVVTGDLTDDGWERPEDLVWAKDWLTERIESYAWSLPGNHDVGNFACLPEGQITNDRFEQWSRVFDPGKHGFGGTGTWILLGLNSMVLGSDLRCEQEHLDRFERELNIAIKARVNLALFIHSPLFIRTPNESTNAATEYWLGPEDPRQRIWKRINQANLKLIGSGHVHQTRGEKGVGSLFHDGESEAPTPPQEKDSRPLFRGGTHIVWAPPASGTWVHAPGLPNPPAPERTGFVLHHLGDDGSVRSEVVECAPMLKTVYYDPTSSAG